MFTVNGDMFGRYVKIPHVLAKKGEKFIFKVIGRLQSNTYCSVPINLGAKDEIQGSGIVDVLRVIQCGIDETKVLTVALKDCELVEPRTNADKIRNMTNRELAEFIYQITDNCSKENAFNQFCDDDTCPGYCKYESCIKWLEND